MVCIKCKEQKHSECKGCTCQHRDRTARTLPVYSERVARAIALRDVGAVHANADVPPIDC